MPNADAAWVDVLPSLAKFTPELKKALGGVMPKAGQEAGQDYAKGFAQTAVSGVERASSQLAAARKKEADAAGVVRVAEAKLQDLRESGRAKAAQLVAAEENLAKAKRTLDAQTDAVTRSTQQLSTAQEQAARGAHQLDDGLSRAEKSGGLLSRTMGGLGSSIKLGLGFLVGGGLISGLSNLFGAADESAKIGRLTEQVIRSTGGAAQVSAKQVGNLAQAISEKTGVDDEAIQSGENLLLTFTNIRNEAGKGNDVFNQATGLINDMSVALGQDMKSSAIQAGKALNDPIKGVTALQKVGVSFTAAQKEQITTLVESGRVMDAQKIILAELGREFGGAAAAAGTPFDKLKVTLGNVTEELGGYLIPVVSKAAGFIMHDLIPAARDGATWVGDHFGPAIHMAGDALGFIVNVGQGAVGLFAALPGPVQTGAVALGLFLVLRGPLDSFFTNLSVKVLSTATSMGMAAASTGVFRATAGGLLTMLGGPMGLAIAGVTIALGFLVSWMNKSDDATSAAAGTQSELAQALMQSKGAIDANVRAAAAKEAQDRGLLEAAKLAGVSLPKVTDAILGQGNALAEVQAALIGYRDENTFFNGTQTESASKVGAAIVALNGLAGQTDTNILKAQELAGATSETSSATGGAVVAAQDWQTQLEDTATAASDAKQATDLLKTSLDILTGANVSTAQAEAAVYDAMAQATEAMKENGGAVLDQAGALNLQTENGRAALDVIVGYTDAANTQIATMIQQGATAEQVTAKDADLRAGFMKTLETMGITGQAAVDLTNKYYGIPEQRNTQITADTQQATTAVQSLQAQIDGLRGRVVDIRANAIGPDLNGAHASGSGRFGLATGGPVFGPGTGTSDSIPAMLSNGEHVLTTREVRAAGGHGAISAWRKALVRGYADGGPVAPASIVAELDTRTYSTQMDTFARQVLKSYEPVQGFIRALQWARSQVGKPYIWGAAGPAGYDCSGFMSAITNVIRGKYPHSRVGSTATFPWGGFVPGNSGLFNIGSTPNAGGGIGHMAGDLLGVPVESTGNHVRVGAGARSSSSSLFNERGHLVFDDGGLWGPGWGFNGTSDLERVLTPPQDDYFRRFVDATTARERRSAVDGASRTVQLYTPDIPHAIRALRAEEQQQDALAPVW